MSSGRLERTLGWLRVVTAIGGRPKLWPAAVRAGVSLAPDSWWRKPPFLPLPDRRWLRFRMETAYGGDGRAVPSTDDVITWLRWQRDLRP